jgi:hypothetical protein
MGSRRGCVAALVICCMLWIAMPVGAEVDAGGQVTYVKGDVSRQPAHSPQVRKLLRLGDTVLAGDTILAGKGARLELKMPDGSYLRFDENTTFVLEAAALDRGAAKRDIRLRMKLGKAWAKVSKLYGDSGNFALSAQSVSAGVRGTVYRMNVASDQSVTVKVYWGQVLVDKLKAIERGEDPDASLEPAVPVLGPQPVAGPQPVSAEEWSYLVGALQQIDIQPDGTVTPPFRFNIQDDLNEWVQWNKARDAALSGTIYEE